MQKTRVSVLMKLNDYLSWKCGWKWKTDHIDTTQIELGQDMDTNTLNIKCVLVWYGYVQ